MFEARVALQGLDVGKTFSAIHTVNRIRGRGCDVACRCPEIHELLDLVFGLERILWSVLLKILRRSIECLWWLLLETCIPRRHFVRGLVIRLIRFDDKADNEIRDRDDDIENGGGRSGAEQNDEHGSYSLG
jgi:hypothetical protein